MTPAVEDDARVIHDVAGPKPVPPRVAEVLQTPGAPLSQRARTTMGSRLGHDFSAVRVHSDSRAARAAEDVRAAAFTVGNDIVFGRGRYAPEGVGGMVLLAHELAHVVQADLPHGARPEAVSLGEPNAPQEREARAGKPVARRGSETGVLRRQDIDVDIEPVSPAEADRLRAMNVDLPAVSGGTWTAIGGMPYDSILPGYSQLGDTCGAASLISALMIWDREHWDPLQPNARVVTASNLILVAMAERGNASVARWAARPSPAVARMCREQGGADCVTEAYQAQRDNFVTELQRIRDSARAPGARVAEADYRLMAFSLYFLWNEGGTSGLSSIQIENIQNAIGLAANDPRASSNVQSFDEIFSNAIVTGLAPDQIAQVAWFVKTGQQHAFLVGRLATGEWFLSDQGPSPAVEFRAPTLAVLHADVRTAASGSYWLFTGTSQEYMQRVGLLPGWTGVRRLAGPGGTEAAAENMVRPGAFLCEVDAGIFTWGSRINRGDFVGTRYALADAQALFSASHGGGLVVEQPDGVFSLYTTTTVSEANLGETSLDESDSAGGVLASRTFRHAWLILATGDGRQGAWFPVY